ncbi:MAG: signal peptidase II [Protaetiibacter sp.]
MSVRALVLLAVVALGILLVDQLAKFLVVTELEVGQTVPVLGEVLQLHFVKNSGAAFSLASGFTWILSLVAVGVIVAIVVFAKRIKSVGWAWMLGLLLGGALGNVSDRLFREPSFGQGHVIDFIELWGFPAIFNVADIAICTAMGLFLLLTLRGVRLDGAMASDTIERVPAPGAADPAGATEAPEASKE